VGPIDIKYHAVSLAAMFLALGVGIIVGSSTNFFGISSLLERQNKVIDRLEANYKEIRKEVQNARDELNASKDYAKSLEEILIPRLLSGKLDGFRFGVITVGDLPGGNTSEDRLLAPLKTAGAVNTFKMRIKPEKLQELAEGQAGVFVNQFGKEILRGSSFGSKFTNPLMRDGTVVSGGFEKPVDCVLFVLGENIDPNVIRDIVLPVEKLINENQGIPATAVFGTQDAYEQIFKPTNFSFFQNTETLSGQMELITRIDELYKQKQGMKKSGA